MQKKQNVITSTLGKFTIEVSLNDTLLFKNPNYINKIIVVSNDILKEELVVIELESITKNLDEIVINTTVINELTLGITQKPVKNYTKSQRMLQTAGDFKPIHLLGILGGNLPVDPIINAINGRTKGIK